MNDVKKEKEKGKKVIQFYMRHSHFLKLPCNHPAHTPSVKFDMAKEQHNLFYVWRERGVKQN